MANGHSARGTRRAFCNRVAGSSILAQYGGRRSVPARRGVSRLEHAARDHALEAPLRRIVYWLVDLSSEGNGCPGVPHLGVRCTGGVQSDERTSGRLAANLEL